MAIEPGDVVVVDFPGATGVKRRPAVVLSTAEYHAARPDAIIGVLTSQVSTAGAITDHVLGDWRAAGLHRPSAFRAFVVTLPQSLLSQPIGHLSTDDWAAVQARLVIALACGAEAQPGG